MHQNSHPEYKEAATDVEAPFNADLRNQLSAAKEAESLSNSQLARALGYSPAVLSLYLAPKGNKYSGDVAGLERRIEDWLRNRARRRASGVDTADCEAARQMKTALEYIRKTNDVGEVLAESGEGKSRAIELYAHANPTAVLFHVRSWARDLGSVEGALFEAVGKAGYDNRTKRAVWMANKLRGSDRMLIVDDAHKLTRPALQFLFDFHDETGCPLALVGTFDLEELLEDDAQRFSRVGLRFEIKPKEGRSLIEHLITTLCCGAKPGAIRNSDGSLPASQRRDEPTNGEFDALVALCEQVAEQHGHYRSVHKQLKVAAEIKETKPKTAWTDAFKAAHTMLLRRYALN